MFEFRLDGTFRAHTQIKVIDIFEDKIEDEDEPKIKTMTKIKIKNSAEGERRSDEHKPT